MSLKRKFRKRKREKGDFDLIITSLADILIIVLVFLLKSYTTDAISDVSIPKKILLPEVTSGGAARDGLLIYVSEDSIKVGTQEASHLVDYRFPRTDLNQDLTANGSSISLMPAIATAKKDLLQRMAEQEAKRTSREEKSAPAEETADGARSQSKGPSVWIISDKRVPYRTIQTVVASAALEGFEDFKLAVVKDQ